MDGSRFDTLTRSLTGSSSRRATLGSLLVGGLGVLGLAETTAKKKGKGKKKKKKTTQSPPPPPFVCPAQRVCGPGCCPEGQVCGSNGACVHPSCCSGDATCGPHTTAGRLCCVAPRVAFCCCDSSSGSGNGYAICCTGAECPTTCAPGSAEASMSGNPNAAGICGLHGGGAEVLCPG